MQNPFDRIPHVDFVPKSVDQLLEEMIVDYEAEYYRQTGEKKTVALSSEERIQIYTEAARFHTAYQLIDRGCKMGLLKYSAGDYLDNLAALFGLERLEPQPSVSRARFTLSTPQAREVTIPAGTRLATADRVYFSTLATLVIPAGETGGEVDIRSMEAGAETAGLQKGAVHILVDLIPFVSEAVNILSTQGGANRESDESLRLRVYYFRDSYSVAGPECAYRYFVREYSQAVEGVSVYSPEPGAVDIRLTLTGGELPEQPFLDGLYEFLEDKRPLTDMLTIDAPDIVKYAVDCTWYLAKSRRAQREEIQAAVDAAVGEYLQWQNMEIGRDITPDYLTKKIMLAGAKRVPIANPSFTLVDHKSICQHTGVNIVFGGIEDD